MRGQGDFDPGVLCRALGPFDLDAPTAGEALERYRDFYQLAELAARPGVRHHLGWVASGEFQIAAQAFLHPEPRGTALMVHGYYDHVGLFGHLLEYLLDRGLSVLTFDFPGHGLSSGPRATIESFEHYVRTLVDVQALATAQGLSAPDHLFGQSMGGAISMEYLLAGGANPFKAIFLFAPLVRPAAWGINRWVYEIARRTITERKRMITENAENPEFMALMRRDPLAPDILPVQWVTAMVTWMKAFEARSTLPLDLKILQGEADRTVDWRYNLKLLEARARTEILRIPRARHHLVNESPAIREEMFRWIDDHLRLP
jgi:alpha-beta hydrolase superfamily lysophospholipase